MKGFNIILAVFLVFLSCKEQKSQSQATVEETSEEVVQVFGSSFDSDSFKSDSEIARAFSELKETDSLQTSFRAKVTDVCKMKGCWMKLSMGDGEEIRVTFKDYGFFVPKDITGREVTVHGIGYIEELSVEDQRHFAEDGGATEEEIKQITSPKVTYSFVADGVVLVD